METKIRPRQYAKAERERVLLSELLKEQTEAAMLEVFSAPDNAQSRLIYIGFILSRYRDLNRMIDSETVYEGFLRIYPEHKIEEPNYD